MRLRVLHRTEYLYFTPVSGSANELRLRPLDTRWQRCESSIISVMPATRLTHYEDLNCNYVSRFEILEPHNRLTISSRATVVTSSKVDFNAFPYGFLHSDLRRWPENEECYPFLHDSAFVEINPKVWRRAVDVQDESLDVFETCYSIMNYIFREFEYDGTATNVATHANEVIEIHKGVCQDFAHAMLALCRCLDIPARYASGYLYDNTADGSLRGADASHAWVEVHVGEHGWIGLDPTNNRVVDESYILLATGRDYRDVAPVIGTFRGGSGGNLNVSVTVTRLDGV